MEEMNTGDKNAPKTEVLSFEEFKKKFPSDHQATTEEQLKAYSEYLNTSEHKGDTKLNR